MGTMQRKVLRAFVSSTYVDLKESRRLVANQLVGSGILPVGMEIFPSSGTGPWQVIKESIEDCDVYVLLIGGRYGSLCPAAVAGRAGVSWTEVEYEYARRLGKHVIALVHASPQTLPRQVVDEHDSPVWAFRKRLEGEVMIRNFQNDVELTAGLYQSLIYVREAGHLANAIDGGSGRNESLESFLKAGFDRRYELVSSNWSHSVAESGDAWDATLVGARALRAQWPEGIAVFSLNYTKATEGFQFFRPEDPPQVTLERCERSESGDAALRDRPRRLSQSAYIHDLDFRPAVREEELCTFQFKIFFPRYRLAYREDVQEATKMDSAGRRDYELCSFKINYPTGRLLLSCFFDDSTGAEPLGFGVRKSRVSPDRAEESRIQRNGFFTQTSVMSHGETGIQMALDVPSPVYNRRYDLLWRPLSRRTLPT